MDGGKNRQAATAHLPEVCGLGCGGPPLIESGEY